MEENITFPNILEVNPKSAIVFSRQMIWGVSDQKEGHVFNRKTTEMFSNKASDRYEA
jgi:hypothetical protein